MGLSTAIGIGAGLLSGWGQSRAADAQGDAAEASLDFLRGVYGDAQTNFAPYLGIGQTGVSGLQALMGGDLSGFYNSPDNVAQREAMNYGMDHTAAARGNLYSGGYQADLSAAQGNLAAQQLGTYRNSLMGLAGLGQQSAAGLASIANQNAGMQQSAYGAIGDANAGQWDALSGVFSGIGNMAGRGMFGGSSYGGWGGSKSGGYNKGG